VNLNLDGIALPVKKLRGTDPVETLDLSGKNLGFIFAISIASLIGACSLIGTLTQVLAFSLSPPQDCLFC
jgi:NLR family CARD domain-containing protein 3